MQMTCKIASGLPADSLQLIAIGQINITNVFDRSSAVSSKRRKNGPAECRVIESQTAHIPFSEAFDQQKAFVVDQLVHHCVSEDSNLTHA